MSDQKVRLPLPTTEASKRCISITAYSMRIESKVIFGTTTVHDILLQARKTVGDKKLYFDGNVDILARPLKAIDETNHNNNDGMVVGYEDINGSIVPIHDVNTIVLVDMEKYDDKTGQRSITLHPVVSIPATSSYIGNQMVYTNPTTDSIFLTMKSMKPITLVRCISSYDDMTVLEVNSTTLDGIDLNDATARDLMAYFQQKFKLSSSRVEELHMKVNGQEVVLQDSSMDSFLRESAPHGGTVTVESQPDMKDLLLEISENQPMEVYLKTLTGKIIPIDCFKETTVGRLKELVQEKERIPRSQQRIICNGQHLKDNSRMIGLDYNVQPMSTMHLILALAMYHPTNGRQDFSQSSG